METAQKIFLFISLLEGVWCGIWNISMPDKINVLNGSCVTINCRFDIATTSDPDLTDTAGGVWYRTDSNNIKTIAFNSSRPTFYFPGNITGKLKYKDCTTIFYNANSSYKGTYSFRIEGRNTLKYNFAQKVVSINVTDSPPKPTVKMFKNQVEVQGEVLEGSSVSLRCSSQTLCSSSPPTLTWSSTDSLSLNGIGSRLQDTQHNQTEIISDLNITVTRLQHGVTFFCNINYQLQTRNTTAQNDITLRVLYAPRNTSVSVFPTNTIMEGSSVNLTCSSDANPAVLNYTWYRENGGQLDQLQTGQNLTFSVTNYTHTGRYYCQATNQHGTQNTSVFLNILHPPRNTSILAIPSTAVLEGNAVTLICNTNANPAVVTYTWYRDIGGQIQVLQTGNNLIISVTNTMHTGRYYCVAQNMYGGQNSSVFLDIQFAPKNTLTSVIPSSIVLEGNPVTLTCNTTANPVVLNFTWYRDIGGQSQLLGTGYNFTISTTNATHSGWYYCAAENVHGRQNSFALLDIQYPPKNTLISAIPSSDVLESKPVTLICSTDANPPLVNYTWYRENGDQLQTGYNLTFNETNTTHTGLYYCLVQNKHGQQNSSVFLDIQYPPRNTTTTVLPFNSVLEGDPVTVICNTNANPAAVNYTWYRDIGGLIQLLQTGYNLTISVANSTHFGWYYCVAENKQGKQNTSVLLDIQFSPENTSISVIPSSIVLESNPVTLICSSNANPAVVNYTWYRDIRGQLQLLQTGYNLTISVTNRAHSGGYYCVAQNMYGQENSSALLDIQYPSEVSSSRCDKTQLTVCLCETNGNPPPVAYWYLSGNPVTNTTNILIREERFSKTSLKSSITVSHSLTLADTLRCVSTNSRGTASTLFQLVPSPQETTSTNGQYVLLGFVIGALLVLAILLIKYLCKRKESSITKVEDATGFNLTNRAAPVAATGYVNKGVLSPAGAATNYPQSPYYSTTNFTNGRPESREMRGDSSLNDDYANARHYARQRQPASPQDFR